MQFRRPVAFILYLGSYLPLALILLAQDVDQKTINLHPCWPPKAGSSCVLPLLHPTLAIGAAVIGTACLLASLLVLQRTSATRSVVIGKVKHVPADIIAYVIPYVVAFVGIDYGSVPKLLGFCVFFLLLLVINQRSGQILMNPVLVVFGWKLYEVEYTHQQGSTTLVGRALARNEPTTDGNYDMGTLQDLMVLREQRQRGGNDGDA